MRQTPGNFAYVIATFIVYLGLAATLAGQPRLDRLNFFDKADNQLFFVTFEYDVSGKNTGRTVYMSDSTFVRRTVFVNDGAGNHARETSFNFNDDTAGYSLFTSVGGKPAVSAYDQFGLDQLGGPVSWSSGDQVTYDVSQRGAVINKIRYTTVAGALSRIDILDNAGSLLYYAQPGTPLAVVPRPMPVSKRDDCRIMTIGENGCKIALHFDALSSVRIEQYRISGQRVSTLFSGQIGPINREILVSVPVAGVYFVKLLVNDRCVDQKVGIITRSLMGGAR
jgi:hypothetical protein